MGKTKQWKSGGEEDKLIKKMIRDGKINKYTTPSTVQSKYPAVFGEFNSQVMRNHLKAIKRQEGLFLDDDDDDSNHSNEATRSAYSGRESGPMDSNSDFLSANIDKSIKLNYPIVVSQYICPETENEKVLMVVALPGGAADPDIALQDDGFWVYIKYTWSKTMFNVQDLFKPQLDNGEFQDYHPMPTSYKTSLSNVRKRIDLAPNGLIKVFLPIKVQTTPSSYKIWGIKRPDGTNLALGKFTGFTKEYVHKAADQKLKYL